MIALIGSFLGSIFGKYALIVSLSATLVGLGVGGYKLYRWNENRKIFNLGFDSGIRSVQKVGEETVTERLETFGEQKKEDDVTIKEIEKSDNKKKSLENFLDQ